jgi:hypothetical protein
MNTATSPSRISVIVFLSLGLAIGFAALWLGAAWAGDGSSAIGSGSGSAIAATPLPIIDAGDGEGLARSVYDAARDGRYKVAVGFLLMLVVFVLRTYALGRVAWFKTKVGGISLAVATALGSVIGLALAAGAPIRVGDVLNALGTALTAAGAWEWMKDLIKKKSAEPTP